MSKRVAYRLLWIPSALVIIGMTIVFATQPLALPIPAPMKRYTTGDKSFRIQHPGNWKAHERSSHAIETEVGCANAECPHCRHDGPSGFTHGGPDEPH